MTPLPTIALYDGKRYRLLRSDDIVYLRAEGSYTNVHLSNGDKFILSRNLKSIAENLPTSDFVRIHHSYVVNLAHSLSYENGSTSILHMSNGEELSVSRTKKQGLLERFVMV